MSAARASRAARRWERETPTGRNVVEPAPNGKPQPRGLDESSVSRRSRDARDRTGASRSRPRWSCAGVRRRSPGRLTRMRRIGVVVNGVTGRMGYRQHLVRSLLAIREQGGVPLRDGTRLMPELVLVGRREERVRAIAERHGVERWTTDLSEALDEAEIYFDAQVTPARAAALRTAIAAGRHVYTEKPTAEGLDEALELARLADEAGIRHGVVQDKLFLPGLLKLRRLVDGGFFGRILSVRGEFGYWIFEGDWQAPNRPSWNYRAEEGGGIALDMLCHWRYVLDNVIAPVRSVSATIATHIPERVDDSGERYAATADDAAYATFELDGGVIAHINSSWTVRVFRDELVEFQVDGTHGSAVAGLRRCRIQPREGTPRARKK